MSQRRQSSLALSDATRSSPAGSGATLWIRDQSQPRRSALQTRPQRRQFGLAFLRLLRPSWVRPVQVQEENDEGRDLREMSSHPARLEETSGGVAFVGIASGSGWWWEVVLGGQSSKADGKSFLSPGPGQCIQDSLVRGGVHSVQSHHSNQLLRRTPQLCRYRTHVHFLLSFPP